MKCLAAIFGIVALVAAVFGITTAMNNRDALPVLVQPSQEALNTAADMQERMMGLFGALFCEVNPIPVKAAMKILGHDCGKCRLPLTSIAPENEEMLKKLLL